MTATVTQTGLWNIKASVCLFVCVRVNDQTADWSRITAVD